MPGFERVVYLDFAGRDELSNPAVFRLCVELTGRHSNIILTHSNGVIIDALKRISLSTSAARPLLPGLKYELPPSQEKLDPRSITANTLEQRLSSKAVPNMLSEQVQGLSQLLAREIAYRHGVAHMQATQLGRAELNDLVTEINTLALAATTTEQPSGYVYVGEKVLFHVFPLSHLETIPLQIDGVNSTIAQALSTATTTQASETLRQKMRRAINTYLEKNERKIAALQEDIATSLRRDDYKRYGELLYANIGTCVINGQFAEVTDFFSEGLERVSIPIDPKFGPTDNAKAYFKRYNRALNTEKHSRERLIESVAQQEYLLTLATSLEQAEDLLSLREIEDEMRQQSLISKSAASTKKRIIESSGPRRFVSPDGLQISVGRNNTQNELLVKEASSNDLWMHVQKAPGSHVLISAKGEVPDRTLDFAANLAAYYSSLRASSLVAVDYTERKNVRRPNGAKPGYVVYENHRTIYVREPREPEVKN